MDPAAAEAGGPPDDGIRWFDCETATWGAWIAGEGVAGTGSPATIAWDAVHFCLQERPGVPVREALLAHGLYEGLFDSELCALLARSVEIVLPDGSRPADRSV